MYNMHSEYQGCILSKLVSFSQFDLFSCCCNTYIFLTARKKMFTNFPVASQACQLEHQLFAHFFPASASDVSSMAPLMDPL